ncbi:hypothetical protein HOLleu_16045 [Holothuria leucospilota]|uniref:Uncharacterized protein n=1 Tax=Holothuria leucospilota TaxID=206669 RepID=A0A9Q1C4N7_HOLLE|nr:hypothetical protein HOLleu_16045 [Holothuria leucospilota]
MSFGCVTVIRKKKSLKPSRQCAAAAARANRVLGLIKRNFSSFSKEIVLNLYKQLVRPHLDYAAQAWSPFYEKDKLLLEQVQRRATRLIPETVQLDLKYLGANRAPFLVEATGPSEFLGASGPRAPVISSPE